MRKFIPAFLMGSIALASLPLTVFVSQGLSDGYGISVTNRYITDFEWSDTQGNSHKISDWNNNAIFLFVGFLSCKVICHKRIQEMLNIEKIINQSTNETTNGIRFLFVTIDPENDDLLKRHTLVDNRSKAFHSAKLSSTDLNRLQRELSENIKRDKTNNISHSGNIYLLTSNRKIEKIYSGPTLNTELIVDDIPSSYFNNTLKLSTNLP